MPFNCILLKIAFSSPPFHLTLAPHEAPLTLILFLFPFNILFLIPDDIILKKSDTIFSFFYLSSCQCMYAYACLCNSFSSVVLTLKSKISLSLHSFFTLIYFPHYHMRLQKFRIMSSPCYSPLGFKQDLVHLFLYSLTKVYLGISVQLILN